MPAGRSQTTSALGRCGMGKAHQGKRRPYCSINLWAFITTALPLVICGGRISTAAASSLRRLPLYGAARRLRGGALNGGGDGACGNGNPRSQQRETLYEAYNMLHTLAQDFHKPFDSPAVLVVGHQTSGKSALIEALMGFQFNQVGGGTKTRRPIALRMQYNPDCDQPRCYLSLENGKEEPRSLQEIQAYIESENRRLERDPVRSFDSREINIRMEYRFCPNMILIDTPGLLHAPSGKKLNAEQRSLTAAAREAENLVIQKMRCQDYVILCVEDTTDWKHATTRNVVAQVDPDMSRTVLVTTKLDTKLPQFGASEDLEDFLMAPLVPRMYRCMLGGPFFTTVPSGRVGRTRDAAYFSNEAFVQAVRRSERDDQMFVATKLGAQVAASCLPRVGVSHLRRFLERRVEECYRRNVARIVPQLQHEMARAEGRLLATEEEIQALSLESLKAAAEEYREHFSRALGRAIQGTIKAPPEKFGETLEAEQLRAGSFVDEADVDPEEWDRMMEIEVGNGDNKLFGGAQYHRVLREFNFAIRHMNAPEVTEDEIANAAGVSDMHDGVNFMRAACVIAVEKARSSFEPVLDSLRVRTVHVMKRLFEVVEHMLKADGMHMSEAHQKPFSLIVKRVYDNFVERSVEECLSRCRDDLTALTRFVTWDLHERSAGALRRSLPDSSMVQIYSLAVDNSSRRARRARGHVRPGDGAGVSPLADDGVVLDQWQDANSGGLGGAGSVTRQKDYFNLQQLMEEASSSRDAARTSAVVSALVQHIMLGWREHFARTIAMKFNCFFLMPFVDNFPFYLRQELEKIYAGDEGDMFDIAEAREALVRRKEALLAECKACHEIQGKFDSINTQLNSAKEIYRDAVEQDLQAVASEAEAEALAALVEGAEAEFGYSSEESGRRGEFDAASLMELPSGGSPGVTRRFGPGIGRSYPREGSASSSGLANIFEDSEEESEDQDFFFNPLSRVDPGAIGDKPPPTDSFDRRRWAAQRRAQRETEASSVGHKSLEEEEGDGSDSIIGTSDLKRSLELGRDGSRAVGEVSIRPEVGDSVDGQKEGGSLEAVRATSPAALEEALRRRRRNSSLGGAGTGA